MRFSHYELGKIKKLVRETYENYTDGNYDELVEKADGAELMMLCHHALRIDHAIEDFVNCYDSILMKRIKKEIE